MYILVPKRFWNYNNKLKILILVKNYPLFLQRASQWSSGSMAGNKTRTAKWTTSSPPCPGKITLKNWKKEMKKLDFFVFRKLFLILANVCNLWSEKSYKESKRNSSAPKRSKIVKHYIPNFNNEFHYFLKILDNGPKSATSTPKDQLSTYQKAVPR